MNEQLKRFSEYLRQRQISQNKMNLFKIYDQFLKDYNRKVNLISKNSAKNIWTKHFLDSIIPLEFENFKDKRVMDLGSGAGFPTVPLRIIEPSLELILLESTTKKCKFLGLLLEKLNIKNAKILDQRFENICEKNVDKIDLILVRAVKMKKKYFKKSFSLLRPSGKLLLFKSGINDKELSPLREMKDMFKYKIINRKIDNLGNRNYILIEKL